MARGKFIVFEGIDGSGKSTQISLLAEYLKGKGTVPYVTREPTGGTVGALIRSCLSGKTALGEKTIAALFVADRLEHVFEENGLKERIDRGETAISDRYYLSSYAYHGAFMPMSWVMDANRLSAEALPPDLTLFLDVEPEHALARVLKRGETERYEKLESLKRVREKYFEAIGLLKGKEKIAVIPSEGNVDETFARVRSAVDEIL